MHPLPSNKKMMMLYNIRNQSALLLSLKARHPTHHSLTKTRHLTRHPLRVRHPTHDPLMGGRHPTHHTLRARHSTHHPLMGATHLPHHPLIESKTSNSPPNQSPLLTCLAVRRLGSRVLGISPVSSSVPASRASSHFFSSSSELSPLVFISVALPP